MIEWVAGGSGVLAGTAALGYAGLRRKGLERWLIPYLKSRHRRRVRHFGEETHLILAICDHYEPKRGNVPMTKAKARVQQWLDQYPSLFDEFRDAEDKPPQHSFFYPQDEYEPELVEMVASLCRRGYGEVEVHLHHDHDTAEGLRQKLLDFKQTLRDQHGLLSTDRETGDIVYGFIHGNWALDNSRRDGRWCGVNNELDILRETGCYADFTMPSAPSETQTSTINQLYWAVDDPERPKSHDRGFELGRGPKPDRGLLMIPGPLSLAWKQRKFGILPRIENGNLQKSQPPTAERLQDWMKSRVSVCNQESWVFVKLYTHGVHEPNQDVLLGTTMVDFHSELMRIRQNDPAFHVHYVTAREMANVALAAAENIHGKFDFIRDYRYHLPLKS
ncbi:hypothetical protein BH11PLA2_BH11PLA2_42230 [soil metagenome]